MVENRNANDGLHGVPIGAFVKYTGENREGETLTCEGIVVADDNGALTVLDANEQAWYCELDNAGTFHDKGDNQFELVCTESGVKWYGFIAKAGTDWARDLHDYYDDEYIDAEYWVHFDAETRKRIEAHIRRAIENNNGANI